MTTTPILILGGAGKTGRHVAGRLRARGVPTRLASRSSEQRFDWYDGSTWLPATAGIDTAYVVPPYDPPGLALAGRFVQHAAANGLRRVVLLSGRGVGSPGRDFEVYHAQLELENAVKDSDAAWTIVRPSWFMQNFSTDFMHAQVLAGELRLPAGDGAEPWIDTEDVADVMVAALLDESHTGETYSLSGPRALTLDEVATELSAATGRQIRYVALEPEEHVTEMVGQGASQVEAEALRDLLAVIRNHRSGYLSDGVRRVLGREPRDFADWTRTTARAGVWSP
ncbi:NmrA family protein [Nonomuraea sp. KC401]|uniref:NAD(P)H-binding protein n=1 Tax=unclassified Nonomuraea TaxID=2593643 RepID=UPI0010FE20F5|nr:MULTISPECIES: NAD(P)H-binding protein [unclassified Nonomuraea]NBE93073.1 NAD(P)H-binding protein [Nonomuraea sp. K271]TLF80367.1 NmrA family protein [Nonomuraea sp. KC401]